TKVTTEYDLFIYDHVAINRLAGKFAEEGRGTTGRLGICRSLPQPLIVVIVFGSRRRHKEPVVSLGRTRSEISVSRPNKLQGVSVGCWSARAGLRDAEMIRDRRPLSAAQVCTILLVEDEILV